MGGSYGPEIQTSEKSNWPAGAGTTERNASFWECGGKVEPMVAARERGPGWGD